MSETDIKLSVGFDQSAVDVAIDKLADKWQKVDKKVQAARKQVELLRNEETALLAQANDEKTMTGKVSPTTEFNLSENANNQIPAQMLLERYEAQAKELRTELEQAQLDPQKFMQAAGIVENIKEDSSQIERTEIKSGRFFDTALASEQAKNNAEKLEDAYEDAAKNADKTARATSSIGNESKKATRTVDGIQKSFESFSKRIINTIKSALIFSVIYKVLNTAKSKVGELIQKNAMIESSIAKIKGNLLTAFMPIWESIQPALEKLFSWLVKITTLIAQVVNKIFGKNAKESAKAAKAMQGQAKATEKLAKTQKQLAGFDTIQKLSDPSAEVVDTMDEGTLKPDIDFSEVTDSLEQNIDSPWINRIMELFNALNPLIDAAGTMLKVLWKALKPILDVAWNVFIEFIEWLTDALNGFADWATKNPEKLQTIFNIIIGFLALLYVYKTVKKVIDFVVGLKAVLSKFFAVCSTGWGKVFLIGSAIAVLTLCIYEIGKYWGKLSPMQKAIVVFGGLAAAAVACAIAVAAFHTAWTVGIAAAAIVGGLAALGITLAFASSGADKVTGGSSGTFAAPSNETSLNGDMSMNEAEKWANAVDWDELKLPALARGAVIPANREFLAILGDQRNGVNIETPLSTMLEAFNMALDRRGGIGGGTAVFQIDGKEFARCTFPFFKGEENRRGVKLSTKK